MGLCRKKSSRNGFRKERRGDFGNDFSTWKKGAIEEKVCTFSSKIWREKKGYKNSSKIATKHNRNGKGMKRRRNPLIYTQNQALVHIHFDILNDASR